MKAPSHLYHLDIILDLHPQCGIVITHRNPLELVSSYSSMMMSVLPEQTQVDPKDMGRRVLEDLGLQVDRSMAVREKLDSGRIYDVQYTNFLDDTLAVVDGIYKHLGLPYGQPVQDMAGNPRGQHGSHDYQLAEFGLSEQQVLDRFGPYIDTFNLAT